MTARRPITIGEAAWLIAPALFYLGMNIPIPGVTPEYLTEVAHGRHSGLLSALTVAAYALAIAWSVGTGRIVLKRYRLRTQSL